ncbi:MAG: AraC family transcriptional regulator [Lachnospiraceae bacterium]|nr:AraC family transcriptional regulator [Lachnospiraceae bacterium]
MSESIAKHERFNYEEGLPVIIRQIWADVEMGENLMNHWHKDLELAFTFYGHSSHYINGECVIANPGRLIVTNSEFIHSIIPDKNLEEEHLIATLVIIIKYDFLIQVFPEYEELYFANTKEKACPEIVEIMNDLFYYNEGNPDNVERALYIKGKIMELLYFMKREGIVKRNRVDYINMQKNIERMRGVISFIENHYTETITQAMIAEKFYFSPVYFSRYFKKCTGMTFTDYLTFYRVEQAKKDLLYTKKNISEIAMDHGFSDERRFIISFKKFYTLTPLKYRKTHV